MGTDGVCPSVSTFWQFTVVERTHRGICGAHVDQETDEPPGAQQRYEGSGKNGNGEVKKSRKADSEDEKAPK